MRARRVLLLLAGVAGCSSQPLFVEAELYGGQAERVLGVSAATIEGSIQFEASAPDLAETTKLFFEDVTLDYLYRDCQRRHPDVRSLDIEDVFPMTLEPGQSQTAQIDFVLSDPRVDGSCGPPDRLQVNVRYYDSQAYEWERINNTLVRGRIDLDIDPDVVGPSDWSCLGQARPPDYESGQSRAMVWVRAFDSGTILPGATVRVCDSADGDCTNPIDEGITDFTGLWPLDVPKSGPYYFEVSGVDGYVTSLFFEYQPPELKTFDITLTPFAESDLQSALSQLGVTAQMGRGHLALTAIDCRGDKAIGVSFNVGGSGITESYWQDGTPDRNATETSNDAFALFANVPASSTVVEADLTAAGETISTRDAWVRAGAVTFLATDPAPIGP